MLSLNELSISANQFNQSKNSNASIRQRNTSYNKSNSQNLFKKCKTVIQQQMNQINLLIRENQHVKYQFDKKSMQVQQLINQIKQIKIKEEQIINNYNQVLQKNQLLHKQMNTLTQMLQIQTQKICKKQNQIKLLQNKIELMSNVLKKYEQQKQNYKTKSNILQQNVQLMNIQNTQIRNIIKQKDGQMFRQIQNLKKVYQILKRRNNIQSLDDNMLYQGKLIKFQNKQNKFAYHNDKNISLTDKKYCKPFCIVKEDPFQTVHLNRYKQISNNSTDTKKSHSAYVQKQSSKPCQQVNPFSIIDRKLNTISPPQSRIRKNFTNIIPSSNYMMKNNSQLNESKIYNPENISLRNSKDQNIVKAGLKYIEKCFKQQKMPVNHSKQMDNQLAQIKREILQQYNKTQIKRQKLNQQRISKTLQQIQNKLQKMAKISSVDDSQSQFQ